MDMFCLNHLVKAGALQPAGNDLQLGTRARLQQGRTHEVMGSGADMFALLAAARCEQDIVWIGLRLDISTLCPSGLQAWLDIDRLIIVEGVSRGELLWAAEQALRSDGRFCVVLEMPDALSLKESRRLQVAAEQGGGLGLILLHGAATTSAAQTRWKCEPIVADHPSWKWACTKSKSGEAGVWQVQCQGGEDAKGTLHMAAAASA